MQQFTAEQFFVEYGIPKVGYLLSQIQNKEMSLLTIYSQSLGHSCFKKNEKRSQYRFRSPKVSWGLCTLSILIESSVIWWETPLEFTATVSPQNILASFQAKQGTIVSYLPNLCFFFPCIPSLVPSALIYLIPRPEEALNTVFSACSLSGRVLPYSWRLQKHAQSSKEVQLVLAETCTCNHTLSNHVKGVSQSRFSHWEMWSSTFWPLAWKLRRNLSQ